MEVDPIKSTLKAPGTKRLKLQYDELLSSVLSNSTCAATTRAHETLATKLRRQAVLKARAAGRGLHSSTFQLNLSHF